MKTLLPLLLLPAALAGCAVTPEQRVDAALRDAGVPPRVASCMAERMVDRLSIHQLLQLRALSKGSGADKERGPKHILRAVQALGDPQIVSVTSRAALGCYIAG